MIKLNKQPEPDILVQNKNKWTSELISYISTGQDIPASIKNKYNHPDIKSILRIETNGGKCMYCESSIAVVAPEHIEHYRPKKIYPQLTFDWNNLGLSCPKCNMNKSDVFDEDYPYINPYTDLPNDHFVFLGTMIVHNPNNKRAKFTELQLELNRPELMEARKERIDTIRLLIDQYEEENNPTLKVLLKKNIDKETAENTPYSMCTKTVVEMMLLRRSQCLTLQ
jgi:uncharacterized protein (TIGR02646 family)